MAKQKKFGEFGNLDNLGNFGIPSTFGMEKGAPPLPPGDPFDGVEYNGDPEHDTAAELNQYQKAVKENIRHYQKTIEGVFDSEFWFAVSFRNRTKKEAFLREFGIDQLGDKYIDGGKLAKLIRAMKAR